MMGKPYNIPGDSPKKLALVTGATGLIGGEIALKLAQSGWDVRALVRPKIGREPADRLLERLQQSRASKTVDLTRIRSVAGDVTQEGLGLSVEEDWIPMVVIHCAADTSFLTKPSRNHPNVLAAERIIQFVKSRSKKTSTAGRKFLTHFY